MSNWPFKKRHKSIYGNSESSTLGAGAFNRPKRRIRSIVSLIGAGMISFVSFGAAAAGITLTVKNYEKSAEYASSWNTRYELDTKNEDPNSLPSTHIKEDVDKTAEAYSKYLVANKINNFGVYPEYYQSSSPDDTGAWISATLPNAKVADKKNDNKKIDNPIQQIFMNDISSSRLSILLNGCYSGTTYRRAIIPQEKFIVKNDTTQPEVSIDKSKPTQVDIQVNEGFKNIAAKWFPDSKTNVSATETSEMYIFRNMNGLISYMNYVVQIYDLFNSTTSPEVTTLWNQLDKSSQEFAQDYWKVNTPGQGNPSVMKDSAIGNNAAVFNAGSDIGEGGNLLTSGTFFSWIDSAGNDKASGDGNVKYAFMEPYILGIVKTGGTGKNDPKSFFPETSPFSNDKKTDHGWLTVQANSRYEAQMVKEGYNNFNFALPTKILNNEVTGWGKLDFKSIGGIGGLAANQMNQIDPSFVKSIFGYSPLLGAAIALIVVALIIGIIIAVLYRIPGLFAFGFILATGSLVLMVMVLTGYVISLGMLIGVFVGIIMSTFAVIGFTERIKKQINADIGFDSAFKNGMKRGLLPALDLHLVTLLASICLVYFGSLDVIALGISLLLYSLISSFMIFVGWFFTNWLFFVNKINEVGAHLCFLPLGKKAPIVSTTFGERRYETTFDGRYSQKKFNIFGKKQIILAVILVAIVTVGIALLFTVGVKTSYIFYGGTRIIVTPEIFKNSAIWAAHPYQSFVHSGGYYYVYFTHQYSSADVSGWFTNSTIGKDFFVQNITAGAAKNYIVSSIAMLSIATGLITAYAFVRLGWTTAIPVLVSLVSILVVTIGAFVACQVYFDTDVVIAIAAVFVIGAYFIFTMVNNISNKWVKRQIFTRDELLAIINIEIKNSIRYFGCLVGAVGSTIIFAMLCSSTSLLGFYAIMFIGLIVTSIIITTILPLFLSWFIRLRYKYLAISTTDRGMISRKNYDTIDEQLIDGINRFKKEKLTI